MIIYDYDYDYDYVIMIMIIIIFKICYSTILILKKYKFF